MAGEKKKRKITFLLYILAEMLAPHLNWNWLHYCEVIRKAETSFTITWFSSVQD